MEFSKGRLAKKSARELKFIVQKGEDAAQFHGHDDGYSAVRADLEAEE